VSERLFALPRPESVLYGRDPQALDILIGLHATATPRILDATSNTGKMWKGCSYAPAVRMDIDPTFAPDVVGDFRAMPFENESFDLIVFDPPHLPVAAASPNSSGIWRERYGITSDSGRGRDGDSVSGQFSPFLSEAKRVLCAEGIVLAKLADIIHNHRYQWHLVDFVCAARSAGLTPCDLLIKRDPSGGSLKSSKWQNVRHLKRSHSYFVVVRKGRCEKALAA